MRIYDIINKKRHGDALSKEEIDFFIDGYMKDEIADYQASSLLMAICINSMNDEETFYLTDAMIRSGETVDLSMFGTLSVDKHSTGGVGDKTTMIIAPIVASLGARVAKMSGRGLGFTGGTVDKLESFGNYSSSLSKEAFLGQVEKIGVSVVGQSANLAPADKKLYALRDVTATVESIPLIASSIMSKKIASGARSIVLDVKVGRGAFMKNVESATLLAESMIKIGEKFGRGVRVLLTNMNSPLGACVGNSVECWEAIQMLSGTGDWNLSELCVALSSNMASLSLGVSLKEAERLVRESIRDGKALGKLKEWITVQGGDGAYIDEPERLLCAKYKKELYALDDGYVNTINAERVGIASMLLGAGRLKKTDEIDHSAGIVLNKCVGEYVKKGDMLCTLFSSSNSFDGAIEVLKDAYCLSKDQVMPEPLIYKII